MSDFFREVDEDYRRERAAAFFRRFQVPLVVLVVAIVAGAGLWRWVQDRRVAQAERADVRYEAAGADARQGHPDEAAVAYRKLAGDDLAGYAILSRLRAAEVSGTRDPDGAAKALDAIASDDSKGTPALRDLARYRGAVLRVGTEDPAAFEREYGRYAAGSFTFHDGMRELLALAALKRADQAAAERYLEQIITDPVAPPAMRSRAQAFRELAAAGPATAISNQPGPASVTPLAPSSQPAGAPAQAAPATAAPSAPAPSAPAPSAPAPSTPAPHAAAPSKPAAPAPATAEPSAAPAR